MGMGYMLFKKKLISVTGSKELSNLLLYIILPSVIIKSYYVERSSERVEGLFVSFFLAIGALLIAILIAGIIFGKKHKIENFGVSFSNAGFMGIPLISAVLGSESVFYISSFVALLNLLQWTYGVAVMTERLDSIKKEKIMRNPIIISIAIGVILFFTQIQLPEVIVNAIGSISNMNAPVAMMLLGIYMAQTDIKSIFTEKSLYRSAAVRLVVIPIVTIMTLMFVPQQYTNVKRAIIIAACAPIGSNVAVFAQMNAQDYKRAVKMVCLSTLFSILTMPCVISLAEYFWK